MKLSKISAHTEAQAGVVSIGLERKIARIKNNAGKEVTDILGWDIIIRGQDGGCYSYYEAQPPLIGLTQPQPISCPLGIIAFDEYKIDIAEAVKIFHSQNGGDTFIEIALSWPLVHPAAPEPYWYFRTNLGHTVVIGANSGQIQGYSPISVLYKAPNK
jgi:hypothetical protein